MLTVITPTCDQPTGMRLLEKFMRRQTLQCDQWIVVDDGMQHAALTMGQEHVLRKRESGCTPAQSLCLNLLEAIERAKGDIVALAEHDDMYASTHLEMIVCQLDSGDIAGDDVQRYYNVAHRRWRIFQNVGASLCQTAMRRCLLPHFKAVVTTCLQRGWHHVDRTLWDGIPERQQSLKRTDTVVGIKGLPGRPGIGVGHRPSGPLWTNDADMEQLRAWIGDDASLYETFGMKAEAA